MSPARRRTLTAIAVAALAGGGAGIAIGLSENDEVDPTFDNIVSAGDSTETSPELPAPDGEGKPNGGEGRNPKVLPEEEDPEGLQPGPSGPRPGSQDEKAAANAAQAYISAIDGRDGGAVCDAFAPGGIEALKLPVNRGSCARSVKASLGYKSGGGQPVWESSQATEAISAQIDGQAARVVVTVFTRYADVREPTLEDDIVYLESSGGEWLVVKPSSTLYRAIGVADVPLEALQPPS